MHIDQAIEKLSHLRERGIDRVFVRGRPTSSRGPHEVENIDVDSQSDAVIYVGRPVQ